MRTDNSAIPIAAAPLPGEEPEASGSPFSISDVLFAIFKYKWLGLTCLLLGLIGAGAIYYYYPTQYRSDAKLLVRYVLDRSTVDPVDSQANPVGKSGTAIINSEIEILTSWDLALQVADAVGLERMLDRPATPEDRRSAAALVQAGLEATTAPGSNIIWLSYRDPDPERAVLVLDKLVALYFDKHLEVHRSVGAFAFVTTQSDLARERLNKIDAALKQVRNEAQVVSLSDAPATLHTTMASRQAELDAALVDLASERARIAQMSTPAAGAAPNEPAAAAPDDTTTRRFSAITARMDALQREQLDLLSHYTAENRLVKANQAQLDRLTAQRQELLEQFPTIADSATAMARRVAPGADVTAEKAKLAGLEARVNTLKEQLADIRARAEEFADLGPQIAELERRKQVEETNYQYFQSSLERARVDEALDPSKMPNINVVQKPAPATPEFKRRNKLIAGFAGGGAAVGVGLIVVFGLLLDRTLKRPADIEKRAGLRYLISIPYIKHPRRNLRLMPGVRHLAARALPAQGDELPHVSAPNFLQRHCEALRDRLILGFELAGKTHTPKLIALTGCGQSAGTSTVAVGLAEALSRTGRGKVLLVDMSPRSPEEQYRINGYSAAPLPDLLHAEARPAPAAENLYLAIAGGNGSGAARPLATRLQDLVPQFKASDFDYILLDLPPVSDSSAALTISGFVDKVVLIAEGETTTPDELRRTHTDLVAARGDVAVVFNKERRVVPRWLASAA